MIPADGDLLFGELNDSTRRSVPVTLKSITAKGVRDVTYMVAVLGPVVVSRDREPIEISRPQVRSLLALLALADGDWVSIDDLAADLWPERAPKSPRAALQVVVSRARREVFGESGSASIESSAGHYRLNSEVCDVDLRCWLDHIDQARTVGDAAAAAEYRLARDLWRGDEIAMGVEGASIDLARERLHRARIDAELDEAACLVRSGETDAAVRLLLEATPRDPLREDLIVAAMRALAALSRTSEALSLAAEFRRTLRDELGASPGALFTECERELLFIPQEPVAPVRTETVPPDTSSWHREIRDEIVGQLHDPTGHPAVIIVESPPGYGLSRLLAGVAGDLATSSELCSGISDDLADKLAGLGGGDVVVVDDAHHMSVHLLSHIENNAGRAVLGVHAPLPFEWSSIKPVYVSIPAASVDSVRRQLSERFPRWSKGRCTRKAEDLVACYDGHPAWIAAAVDVLDDVAAPLPIPDSARDRLSDRAQMLSPAHRRIVEAAAVLGAPVRPRVVAACLGAEPDEVLGAMADAAQCGLIEPAGHGEWKFVDPLAAEVLVVDVPLERKHFLHAQAASWLRLHDGNDRRAAAHFLAALPLVDESDAVSAAFSAADMAIEDGDHEEAREFYVACGRLSTDSRARDRAMLGEALASEILGEFAVADQLYNEVISRSGATDPDMLATAAIGGAGHASRIGGQEERRRRLGIAYRRLPDDHPRADEVAAEYGLELLIAGLPVGHQMWRRLRDISQDPESEGQLAALRVVLVLRELHQGIRPDEATRFAELALAAVPNGRPGVPAALSVACQLGLVTGQWPGAEQWIDELQQVGEQLAEPRARWQSAAYRAALAEARGFEERATELAATAAELGGELGIADAATTHALHHLARAYRVGSTAAFLPAVEEAGSRYRFPVWRAIRGLVEFDAGNERVAAGELVAALDSLEGGPDTFRSAAVALVLDLANRLDQLDRIDRHLHAFTQRSGQFVFLGYGGPFLGPADHFLALGASATGDLSAAAEWRRNAAHACARSGAAWVPPGQSTESGP